jgi:hypothetical protein
MPLADDKKIVAAQAKRVHTASRREAVVEIPANNQAKASMAVQQKMLYKGLFLWQH